MHARSRGPGWSVVVLAVGCFALGCGEGEPADAGPGLDAGRADAGGGVDAGFPDAGPIDAGAFDAGPLDAGPLDAGPPDAGGPDAGPGDAGAVDAGTLDGGAPDAGAFDAGPPDAGPPDAGPGDAGCLSIELSDGGCVPLAFSEVCELQALTVLSTGVVIDDQAGGRMGLALQANCTPPPTLRTMAVADAGVITAQGAPLVGRSEALVCGGGGFFQKHVDWLEAHGVTEVYDSSSSTTAVFSLRDGGTVVSTPWAQFDGGFDYFVVELVRSAPRGPLSVVGYGLFAEGTSAAAWFFEHRVAPQHGTFPDSWYVVRWGEVDGDGVPGAGDDYTVLASGRQAP